jgi:hypothetical protein
MKTSTAKTPIPSDDELLRRAMAGYFRAGNNAQPASATSGVETVDGRTYVVLRNVSGILAVYRFRGTGLLRKLKRWPSELEA